MKPIIIKGKVFLSGNSYGIRVKKALVDSQVLTDGQEVTLIYDPDRKLSEKDKEHPNNSPVVLRTRAYNIRNFLGNSFKGIAVTGT